MGWGGKKVQEGGNIYTHIADLIWCTEETYDYTVEVRNRFKGLDLIDKVPDKLWMEVRDPVQETGIKTIPKEKKCKKAKWLSGEALKIAVKRSEKQRRKGKIYPFE